MTATQREGRALMLRANEATIAERARATGRDEVVVVVDANSDPGRMLAETLLGKPEADHLVAESAAWKEMPTLVLPMDRKRLARLTRGRWPMLSARYAKRAPDGEVWVLVIAHGGATLASFSRDAGEVGAVPFLELDGAGE